MYEISPLPLPFEVETKGGFLVKYKMGKSNFYINQPLFDIFTNP